MAETIEELTKQAEKLAKELGTLRQGLKNLGVDVSSVDKHLRDTESDLKKNSHEIERLNHGVSQLSRSFAGLLTLNTGVNLSFQGSVSAASKYGTTLFEVSKAANAIGQDYAKLKGSIDSLSKSTLFSRQECAEFIKTLQQSARTAGLTTLEQEKLGRTLSRQFVGNAQAAQQAGQMLAQVMEKDITAFKNMERMDPRQFQSWIQSMMLLGRVSFDQAQQLSAMYDMHRKGDDALSSEQKRNVELAASQKAMTKAGEDFMIQVGSKLAPVLIQINTILSNVVGTLGSWIEKNPTLIATTFKWGIGLATVATTLGAIKAASGGMQGLGSLLGISGSVVPGKKSGILSGLTGLLGGGRGKGTPVEEQHWPEGLKSGPVAAAEAFERGKEAIAGSTEKGVKKGLEFIRGGGEGHGAIYNMSRGGLNIAAGAYTASAASGVLSALAADEKAYEKSLSERNTLAKSIAKGILEPGETIGLALRLAAERIQDAVDNLPFGGSPTNRNSAIGEGGKKKGMVEPVLESKYNWFLEHTIVGAMRRAKAGGSWGDIAFGSTHADVRSSEESKLKQKRLHMLSGVGTESEDVLAARAAGIKQREITLGILADQIKQAEILAQNIESINAMNESLEVQRQYVLRGSGDWTLANTLTTKNLKNLEDAEKKLVARKKILADNIARTREILKTEDASKWTAEERRQKEELIASESKVVLDLEKQITQNKNQQISAGTQVFENMERGRTKLEAQLGVIESQYNIAKTMYMGMGPQLDMLGAQVDKMEEIKNSLKAQHAYAISMSDDKEKGYEFQLKALALEKQINDVTMRQLEITRDLREGYLDALRAFTNVSGTMSKIITRREVAFGLMLRQGLATPGMRAGGIGLNQPYARFASGGGGLEFSLQSEQERVLRGRGAGQMLDFWNMRPQTKRMSALGAMTPDQQISMFADKTYDATYRAHIDAAKALGPVSPTATSQGVRGEVGAHGDSGNAGTRGEAGHKAMTAHEQEAENKLKSTRAELKSIEMGLKASAPTGDFHTERKIGKRGIGTTGTGTKEAKPWWAPENADWTKGPGTVAEKQDRELRRRMGLGTTREVEGAGIISKARQAQTDAWSKKRAEIAEKERKNSRPEAAEEWRQKWLEKIAGNTAGTEKEVKKSREKTEQTVSDALKGGTNVPPPTAFSAFGQLANGGANSVPMNTLPNMIASMFGLAGGGRIGGTGTSDTVPALLTPGEVVINRRAASRFAPLLEAINSNSYALGGVVGMPGSVARGISNGGGVSINIGGIRGDSAQKIMTSLNRQVSTVINKMMVAPGTTGRRWEESV